MKEYNVIDFFVSNFITVAKSELCPQFVQRTYTVYI